MLKEEVKQEIDKLNDDQLKQVESFIASIKLQAEKSSAPLWQRTTPAERAKDLEEWASQFPLTGGSLPDEAYDRENIYYGDE
ncbi:hypothetical protein H6F89_07045 [Cyanobacteria bacterium FACHB-63]|nr:hypothetical protein [Cyanobacteria bacterium FACHB-63]